MAANIPFFIMRVDEDLVKKVSKTCMLKIEESDLKSFVKDFEEVFKIFNKLDEVKTEGVSELISPNLEMDKSRFDVLETCLTNKLGLKNVLKQEGGFIKGPKTVK